LAVLSGRSDQLTAVDTATGEIAWTFPAEGWFPSSPVWQAGLVYALC
jgi:outer membrane protein assembly factor BamB